MSLLPATRRFRLLAVLLALGALLFAQGTLAGYVCPGTGGFAETAQSARHDMPCADAMAADDAADRQAGLCHAHCQSDHAASDSYQPPAWATLAQLGVGLTLAPAPPAGAAPFPAAPRADAGPPLAIRHCCLRN